MGVLFALKISESMFTIERMFSYGFFGAVYC